MTDAAEPAPPPPDVAAYLDGFAPEVAERLHQVRRLLLAGFAGSAEPDEKVRYGIPAVMLAGRYGLHYAGWKKHIGLYPVPVMDEPLESQVSPLRSGKDSVTLRHDRPLPVELVSAIAADVARRHAAG